MKKVKSYSLYKSKQTNPRLSIWLNNFLAFGFSRFGDKSKDEWLFKLAWLRIAKYYC